MNVTVGNNNCSVPLVVFTGFDDVPIVERAGVPVSGAADVVELATVATVAPVDCDVTCATTSSSKLRKRENMVFMVKLMNNLRERMRLKCNLVS